MNTTPRAHGAVFATTRWSVVLAAGSTDPAHVARGRAALGELAALYWYPLYAFVRRAGHGADDAADLVQAFFALLLEREDLRRADPARGRFRNWLLVALRNFLANERERERALRRGGGRTQLSIDALAIDGDDADARFAREPADERTPEARFEREWAEAVLASALARLRAEQERIGRAAHFDALRPALVADDDAPAHAHVAAALDLSENAVRVALHRLRTRFGELVRDEVAGTLERPADVDAELRELFDALGGR